MPLVTVQTVSCSTVGRPLARSLWMTGAPRHGVDGKPVQPNRSRDTDSYWADGRFASAGAARLCPACRRAATGRRHPVLRSGRATVHRGGAAKTDAGAVTAGNRIPAFRQRQAQSAALRARVARSRRGTLGARRGNGAGKPLPDRRERQPPLAGPARGPVRRGTLEARATFIPRRECCWRHGAVEARPPRGERSREALRRRRGAHPAKGHSVLPVTRVERPASEQARYRAAGQSRATERE